MSPDIQEGAGFSLSNLEFEYRIFDLYTGVEKELRDSLLRIADEVKQPMLRGPLFSITHELAANGLKALYKQVYFRYFLEEIGLDEIPYEEWLSLFKTEIEVHQAENFARVCRDKDIFVHVQGRVQGDVFRIEIVNDGAPSDVEMKRLQNSIKTAKESDGPPYLFLDDDDEGAEQKEGGGIGIMMIIVTLRNMGLPADNFDIFTKDGRTFARLDVPVELLLSKLS